MERVYNKLVRDKIPQIILANQEKPIIRILNGNEYKKALEDKLFEECTEVINSNAKEKSKKRGGFDKRMFINNKR